MSNHFQMLLEVTSLPVGGISDGELLKRLSVIYTQAAVAVVAREIAEARSTKGEVGAAEVHARHTYRMHHLSEFMKTLLQRKRPKIDPLSIRR
jgi:putative transposase